MGFESFMVSFANFFVNLKPKNIKYASLFTLFFTLFIISILLISLGFKYPLIKFNKWVAQGNSEDLYSCTPYFFNLFIECDLNSTQLLYTIKISHTEDKAIVSISQPQEYTMDEGIIAYKGYKYSDNSIMIKINEVGLTHGVNISISALTNLPLWIILLFSFVWMVVIYSKNKKIT